VLITRGEQGMSLFEKGGRITHIPTVAREVFDVTGAGDTVISALTLAMAAGAKIADAAKISNYAAGIVVGVVGTATVTPAQLKQRIMDQRGKGDERRHPCGGSGTRLYPSREAFANSSAIYDKR